MSMEETYMQMKEQITSIRRGTQNTKKQPGITSWTEIKSRQSCKFYSTTQEIFPSLLSKIVSLIVSTQVHLWQNINLSALGTCTI